MVQMVLRREYLVACDGCTRRSAALATPEQAHELARSQGWEPILSHCAVGSFTTWLCPTCQSTRQADRRNAS